MKGVNIIKRIILMMLSVFLLSACSEENNINYFPSKEAALEDIIQTEDIQGSIDLITTMNSDGLLVVEQDKSNYFVGELLEGEKGYTANRISANVVMELGGSWELKTMTKNKYTIYFEKKQENQNYILLSNGDYYISLEEGYQITKEESLSENSIRDIKAVKN